MAALQRQEPNSQHGIAVVVDKLQHLAVDGKAKGPDKEEGPGMVADWDFVSPRAVYDEYLASPYQNHKLPVLF